MGFGTHALATMNAATAAMDLHLAITTPSRSFARHTSLKHERAGVCAHLTLISAADNRRRTRIEPSQQPLKPDAV
jgi:hypothetical protein